MSFTSKIFSDAMFPKPEPDALLSYDITHISSNKYVKYIFIINKTTFVYLLIFALLFYLEISDKGDWGAKRISL